jgi:hypothetical protein
MKEQIMYNRRQVTEEEAVMNIMTVIGSLPKST